MARHVARWELAGVGGAVVVVDVIRAFTTAAYAFGSGAAEIYLVDSVEDALADQGRPIRVRWRSARTVGLRPDGFDFPNSPAMVRAADLDGRTLGAADVGGYPRRHRRGRRRPVVGGEPGLRVGDGASGERRRARRTDVCDHRPLRGQTRRERCTTTCSPPTLIERARTGEPLAAAATARALLATEEARKTLALGPEHCDPTDIELAAVVDAFDFAMEVERTDRGLRLTARPA